NTSAKGGQPTGTTALATDLRIRETASPRRKTCTSCPASDSASPWRKGKAALVGSSDPHALFIMILSLGVPVVAGAEAVAAMNGSATRLRRKDRRIISGVGLLGSFWFGLTRQ